MEIPFVDLHRQYLSLKEELDFAISEVIRTSSFIRGHFVEAFESEFSRKIGVNHCVSCANGTDSLFIAMNSLGLKEGDEVIVPAHSWISTSETVTLAGGTPVFCDVDDTYTIDPLKIQEKISPNTVGIIPVHLYGQPADMDQVMAIASKNRLWVIEDCAQAHMAIYKNQIVGTFGDAASFSFYPGKNLGAMGDAGAIVTNRGDLATKMTAFARHGGLVKGQHLIEGMNSRLDGLQAAILSVKLRKIDEWTRARQVIANTYLSSLKHNHNFKMPFVADLREHVWHLFVIQHEKRSDLQSYLHGLGIGTSINYPVALPYLPAYSRFEHRPQDFPRAFHDQSRVLSLPIYPELTFDKLDYIICALNRFDD
jgi:dTDP-4-amino-4,6-dideoxygalactose transaminase